MRDALARLSGSDFTSLLLDVFRARAARLQPAAVLRHYERERLVRPASDDPLHLLRLEQQAFSLLPEDFDRLELAPLAPLGTTAVLGDLSQDRAVATVRNCEVLSDVTNVLALEAAARRRRGDEGVKLCACERVVRPEAAGHFRLLGLASAGRTGPHHAWETRNVREHLDFYLRLIEASGLAAPEVRVGGGLQLDCDVAVDEEERRYYDGGWFSIDVDAHNVVDGGFVNWTQRLLSDRKERLLISGVGIDRLSELAVRE
jgi:hypothetical protein